MSVKSEFGMLSWECLNCHEEKEWSLDDFPIEPLKEDLFKKAEHNHYDLTYSRCQQRQLRMVIIRVYTEEA